MLQRCALLLNQGDDDDRHRRRQQKLIEQYFDCFDNKVYGTETFTTFLTGRFCSLFLLQDTFEPSCQTVSKHKLMSSKKNFFIFWL